MATLNFRTFDLNLLRVFDEVMAERSLTRAAHNLSLTQPAVSNALRRLRDTLGDELVRRAGQSMEPTPRALAIWPEVREALRQLQRSLAPDTFDPATTSATFVLAMADATAAVLVPGLVRITEAEAPGVQIRVVPLATRDPRKLLADEAADMAVGYFPAVLADLTARSQAGEAQAYLHQRLYHGEYVCVMRRGHPLSEMSEGSFTIDHFCEARHMLVSFSGRPYGFIDEALALLGRQRRVAITVNQFFTAGRVVAQSDLLTVLPRHFVGATGLADRIVWRPLPFPVPTVHVDALWHSRLQPSSAHEWLRAAITRATHQYPGLAD
ncbi:MAG: LysR family transcriptional regulator [Pseudomonadota bacterium]